MTSADAVDRSGQLGLVLIGAVATTLCDAIHVHTSTLSYTTPAILGQAWWVFPQFVVAFVAMTSSYLFLASGLSGLVDTTASRSKGSARAFVEAMSVFVFAYLVSAFGNAEPVLLSWLLYSSFLLRWAFSYERGWLLVLALAMAVSGMLVEGLISAAGLFAYRHVDVFQVPLWLGAVYMHGALSLREGMRWLVYRSVQPG